MKLVRSLGLLPLSLSLLVVTNSWANDTAAVDDPNPQQYRWTARASELDADTQAHPAINFLLEKDGLPQDVQHASVDTRVPLQGKLVIWMMAHNEALFDRLNSYGLHAIRVHYANGWFNKLGDAAPEGDDQFLGRIRLEAATGEDFSEAVDIPKADGMQHRALVFLRWLANQNPHAGWEMFLTDDRSDVRWDRVIMSGASHGSTTSARFAKHQRVDRVVMLCGPRDQYESWQALPSATPANRYFAFSHVLDTGWSGEHYCRSWQLLDLHRFGPIVNVDQTQPPYGSTRRLITDADVGGDAKRAHSSVTPGRAAVKDDRGGFLHEEVWRYLYTHPVELTGAAVPTDPDCRVEPE